MCALMCAGHDGDNGAPSFAKLTSPRGLAVTSTGELFIAVTGSHCVRHVNAAGTNITTVAGVCAASGGNGADGTATSELLSGPTGVALSSDGGTLYIADTGNNKVRRKQQCLRLG
jgi:DNA-binding beta-propeller fold protein YncE